MDLRSYASNVTSQFGEDGIIGEILQIIGSEVPKFCVEFGAWDGRHLSNTWTLINHQGWSGCLIEAHPGRYKTLQRTYSTNPKVTTLNALVTDRSAPDTSLNQLLDSIDAPKSMGLLSIDIDGNDYNVWRDFDLFTPAIVVIEYNYTIPPTVEYIDDGGRSFMGSSALALNLLARSKGYRLVACTIANCIFVRHDLSEKFGDYNDTVDALMPRDGLTFFARNFAGEVVLSSDNVAGPMIKFIGYRSPRKWVKFGLGRRTFHYLGRST